MLYRLQSVLRHVSGLPEDNVSNTLWVQDDDAETSLTNVAAYSTAFKALYNMTVVTGSDPPWFWLSESILQTGHQIKATPINIATGDDTRGPGNPAMLTDTFDFIGSPPSRTALPSEVAKCMSFRNTSFGAVPPAQRRGRIFFGPLRATAVVIVGGIARPQSALINDLAHAARNFHETIDALPNNAQWVVYSRPFAGRPETPRPGRTTLPELPPRVGATYRVNESWVDNAFDTQRRRGEERSTRTFVSPANP